MVSDHKKQFNNSMSACLVGVPCRWNQRQLVDKKALEIYLHGQTLVVCPEILAGMATPRPACEIVGGEGKDVLAGRAKVLDAEGHDYTTEFIDGASKALDIIKSNNIKKVYLKSGSPSCGAKNIYDGSFSGSRKPGLGVFSALLVDNGIEIEELG